MSKKSFASAPKPQRQPTAEEIEGFEATGRPVSVETETQKATDTLSRNSAFTETRTPENTGSRAHAEPGKQEAREPETQEPANTEIPEDGKAGSAEPIVRLTIDLPESVHTRFKAACAVTRRKMVQEVRIMIEQRTGELESVSQP